MLVKYAKQNPDLSMREIGEVFGISESRVSRILTKYNAKS